MKFKLSESAFNDLFGWKPGVHFSPAEEVRLEKRVETLKEDLSATMVRLNECRQWNYQRALIEAAEKYLCTEIDLSDDEANTLAMAGRHLWEEANDE